MLHWFGALLIITGCTAIGFGMAAAHRREEALLHQLLQALDQMQAELRFRLTPLPELCRKTANSQKNRIGQFFGKLYTELHHQICPEVSSCMHAVLATCADYPDSVRQAFELLGKSLGQFDLEGQLQGLESVKDHCVRELEQLSRNRDVRLRSYQTLGLCAGAALAILFV